MAQIAILGEALVDLIPVHGSASDPPDFRPTPGGSPLNVAVGLARLGVGAHYAGRLSRDLFGRFLRSYLERNGVGLELATVGDEPSPLAFVSYLGDDARYQFRWEGTADRLLRPEDLQIEPFLAMDALHFGSVSLALSPGADAILDLARELQGSVTLTFDPNVRDGVVTNWRHFRARVFEAIRMADIVKLSDRDISSLGLTVGKLESLRKDRRPSVMFVTLGGNGADLYLAGQPTRHYPAAKARAVVDTVGAGDAFMSGLLAALAHRSALNRRALERVPYAEWDMIAAVAIATAAITCERAGADPPDCVAVRGYLGQA